MYIKDVNALPSLGLGLFESQSASVRLIRQPSDEVWWTGIWKIEEPIISQKNRRK
jgi:hypothetical protein